MKTGFKGFTTIIRVLVILSLLSPLADNVHAQGTMMMSNEDFGVKMTIFADNYAYEYSFLDDERMRILYDCTLSFKEKGKDPLKAEYILQIGKATSKFYSHIQHQCDSMLVNGNGKEYLTPRYRLYQEANFLFVQDCFYKDLRSNDLTFTGRLVAEDYEYTETLPAITWKMLEGSKTICGYTCHKAEGYFRGRTYEVWFTEEIPSSAGPWKLSGLPGAILSASDFSGECSFIAEKVLQGNGKIFKAQYPYIKIARKQYTKMQQQYLELRAAFSSQHTSRTGIRIIQTEKQKPLPAVIELEKDPS
ncbi:MAG: GLPGLI family protein [Bacteroidales bacterium]|nr:GLPGLI family protein [Bacteroidales bacterium]MBQ9712799.1 GLPGLI family protein [Bacteroidales bacterium]